MRTVILAALGAAFGTVVLASGAAAAPLGGLQWSKRVLLVFASAQDPLLARQAAAIAAVPEADLRERDLVILHVPPTGEAASICAARTYKSRRSTFATVPRC